MLLTKAVVVALSIATTLQTVLAEGAIPTAPAYLYRAVVVRVVDGDTIDVDIDLGFYVWLKNQRVRLLGIDAPEVKGSTRKAGDDATRFLTQLIGGQEIIIRTVKGRDDADRSDSFGRWLGTVYFKGTDINKAMLDSGHAVPYEGR